MNTEDPVFGLQWAAMSTHLWATITDAERDALTLHLLNVRCGSDPHSLAEQSGTMGQARPAEPSQALRIARYMVDNGDPIDHQRVRARLGCSRLGAAFGVSSGTVYHHLRTLDRLGVRVESQPTAVIDLARLEELEMRSEA